MEFVKSNTELSVFPDLKVSVESTSFEDLIDVSLDQTPEVFEEKEQSSSDESDDEDSKEISEQQKVSHRKRVQNAQFEAMSVFMSILSIFFGAD